jgi:F-type H+-transporting ATPase subunit epsilon
MNTFKIHIVSLDKTVYDGEAYEVILPSAEGEMAVLANHMPLIAPLLPGEIVIKKDPKGEQTENLVIGGGFLEVLNNRANLLVHSAEKVTEIDEERALEAKKKAEDALKEYKDNKIISDQAYAQTAASLQRALARLRIIEKHRKRR